MLFILFKIIHWFWYLGKRLKPKDHNLMITTKSFIDHYFSLSPEKKLEIVNRISVSYGKFAAFESWFNLDAIFSKYSEFVTGITNSIVWTPNK